MIVPISHGESRGVLPVRVSAPPLVSLRTHPLFVAQRRRELIEQRADVFSQLVRFPDFRERKLRHLVMVLKSRKARGSN